MKTNPRFLRTAGLLGAVLFLGLTGRVFGYGKSGHEIVGAIADFRLSGSATAGELRARLGLAPGEKDLHLEDLAPLPDAIKEWDKMKKEDKARELVTDIQDEKGSKVGVILPAKLRQELWEYFKANSDRVNGQIRHHIYHFCDIPVADGAPLKYVDGQVGTPATDIVHTIADCYRVLHDGAKPVTPGVTPGVAIILLAHFLGDLHQPLHIGAEYYRLNGSSVIFVDPNKPNPGDYLADEGGNLIAVREPTATKGEIQAGPKLQAGMNAGNLHATWDDDAVTNALQGWSGLPGAGAEAGPYGGLAAALAKAAPAPGLIPAAGSIDDWIRGWAEEILPLARQAHDQLKFGPYPAHVANPDNVTLAVTSAPAGYLKWSGSQVQIELVRGGYRLAWLLERALAAPSTK